jgi:hypothetical protein
MTGDLIYHERVSSNKTEALFVALTLLFLLFLVWRVTAGRLGALAWVFLCLSGLFLFYSVNYRTLIIGLTSESLKLTFGIFTWRVSLDNVEECHLDEIPPLMRMGGAGIHFMSIRKRYRASFNFLEYPRVVIAFKMTNQNRKGCTAGCVTPFIRVGCCYYSEWRHGCNRLCFW